MSDRPEPETHEEDQGYPWSMILLIVAAAIYLLWRLLQGIGWLVDRVGGLGN